MSSISRGYGVFILIFNIDSRLVYIIFSVRGDMWIFVFFYFVFLVIIFVLEIRDFNYGWGAVIVMSIF